MRTVKRATLPLNTAKHKALQSLCRAYSAERRYWLDVLKATSFQALLGSYRKIRDHFVKEGYQSNYGLQARHWKLALQDAVETWDKYWQALFVKVRSKISRYYVNESEKRYAYFLIKGYEQFSSLMKGEIPSVTFEITLAARKRICGYVRRTIKKIKGKKPVIKKVRSVKFDANCYDLFEHKGQQYIKLMSLEKGKRIVLPLKGKAAIQGNITVVITQEAIEVHVSQELVARPKPFQSSVAIDFGYTEVCTDNAGNRYGDQFGKILTKRSDLLNEKMQKRHRLHALAKDSQKKANIYKYNLGKKKLFLAKQQSAAALTCEINRAINQLLKTTQPQLVITEDLSHLFTYNKSKAMNRKLSSWLRGEIQDRIAFKALAEGFRHEQVNPAYGSQICPECDFVDSRNRVGDKFTCLYCRHEDIADRVAAENYAKRYGDLEITLYTPYREVKTIHLGRFHRRLEAEQSATVPGRTLETVLGLHPPTPIEGTIAGREQSRKHRAVNQRAKQNKYVLTRF